jgi:chitin synthase
MAYHQQNHDPYYDHLVPDSLPTTSQYPQQPAGGYYPNQQQQPQQPQQHYGGYDDGQANWDAKSSKSYNSQYGGSQVHLNPQYEMSQVSHQPPMPSVPYNQQGYQQGYSQQQGYPPSQAPMRQNTGYSEVQAKMMKRRSVRQVELQQGNLVLDIAVPSHIVPTGETSEERTKMRYTAATCDPDDFMRSKYSLRPYLLGRHTELFIVMTMCVIRGLKMLMLINEMNRYNEDEVLFVKTMNAYAVSP